MYPNSIKNLIECFKSLPGIGEKTAERLAFSVLNFDEKKIDFFSSTLLDVKNKIKRCKLCNNICEDDICSICSNDKRNKGIIFIVEKEKDVFIFEKLGIFSGLYYVLGGVISPINGIGPEDINIKGLIDRIKESEIKEVILALKPNIEGETTMQYIAKILEDYDLKISKLATGVPIGTDIEFIDCLTLEMALEGRKYLDN